MTDLHKLIDDLEAGKASLVQMKAGERYAERMRFKWGHLEHAFKRVDYSPASVARLRSALAALENLTTEETE